MPRSRNSIALVEDEETTLITLLRGGAPLHTALAHINRDPREFIIWLAKPGQKRLRGRIGRATSEANVADLGAINAAASDGNVSAAKSLIEIRTVSEREAEIHRINAIALGS